MWPFSDEYPTCAPSEIDGQEFDYIIVGAGTAGCVVASRLSEDPSLTVLLIERGPLVDTWSSYVPLLSADFNVKTAPVYRWTSDAGSSSLEHGVLDMVSGKAFGGTSKVNASIYHRCLPAEYNAWAAAGRQGWSWNDVEPFFKMSERNISANPSEDRGHQGPWVNRRVDPIAWDFVKSSIPASAALGLPISETMNGPCVPAVGCMRTESTLDEKGRRRSTFDCFLPSRLVRARAANLKLCPSTIVTSITCEHSEKGVRAVGVIVEEESSLIQRPPRRVRAKREVILCAGAIATPHLLLLSGIGPADELQKKNVKVQLHHPNVGKGLQDHLAVALIWKTPRSDTLYDLRKNILLVLTEFVRYLLWGRGLFLLPLTQVMIFARSALLDNSGITQATGHEVDGHKPENLPDIEIMPVATGASPKPEIQASVKEGATSLICVLLRPRSRGEVRLAHLDPRTRPQCHFNAMHDPEDMVTMKKAIRLGLALGAKIRESGYPLGDFLVGTTGDDADMESLIKGNIMSTYHYASSCRMAPLAEGGVVNDRLQVHGVDGLRIADASIFPSIPAGHLQAPAVMVGEKCAAMIQAKITEAA